MSVQRLRTENRLLRQRVELLEAESSELADRLVRGQVSRAEEEETTFVVQRELAALRHTHLETSHQLEMAHEEIRNLSLLMEESVSCNPCILLWAGLHHATRKESYVYGIIMVVYPSVLPCTLSPLITSKQFTNFIDYVIASSTLCF